MNKSLLIFSCFEIHCKNLKALFEKQAKINYLMETNCYLEVYAVCFSYSPTTAELTFIVTFVEMCFWSSLVLQK